MPLLTNAQLSLTFADSPAGPLLAGVANHLSGRRVTFDASDGFALVVDGVPRPVRQRDCRLESSQSGDEARRLTLSLHHQDTALAIEQDITLHGPVARMRLRVRNDGTASLLLRDVTFLQAQASEPARQGQTDVDLSRGDPGAFTAGHSRGAFDATPLFLGDDLFLGVDWPVAEN